VLVEGALVLGIVYLLGQQSAIYIFLLVFDGYTAAIFTRRWQAVLLVCVLTVMVGLGYVMLLGWQAGLLALWGDLFWIALAVASAEIYVRQWEQREHIELLHEKLEAAHEQLRDYTRKSEEVAVIHERARLAHEIHDTLGHTLTALDVQLSLCAHLPSEKRQERDEIIERAGGLVRSSLTDLRRAVKALKPAVLETLTLSEALKALIHDFQSKNNLHVSCQVEGEAYTLPQSHALFLYHGATEALTNVLRHASGAVSVEMRLCFNPAGVHLTISNDSCAYDVPQLGTGTGLSSLAERIHALAGHFTASADADGNFVVAIELPVA
jgi:signal transduction histidine kinase